MGSKELGELKQFFMRHIQHYFLSYRKCISALSCGQISGGLSPQISKRKKSKSTLTKIVDNMTESKATGVGGHDIKNQHIRKPLFFVSCLHLPDAFSISAKFPSKVLTRLF